MDDADRVIGRLEEFKDWSQKEFAFIREELHQLNRFRWTVYGGSAVVSTAIVVLIEVFIKR